MAGAAINVSYRVPFSGTWKNTSPPAPLGICGEGGGMVKTLGALLLREARPNAIPECFVLGRRVRVQRIQVLQRHEAKE